MIKKGGQYDEMRIRKYASGTVFLAGSRSDFLFLMQEIKNHLESYEGEHLAFPLGTEVNRHGMAGAKNKPRTNGEITWLFKQ